MPPRDVQTLRGSNSDVVCETKQKTLNCLSVTKIEIPRQLCVKSRRRDAHDQQKTSLWETRNSTKRLGDPRILKDHSFPHPPPGWDTRQSRGTLQLFVRLTHYSSMALASCPRARDNNPGQSSNSDRSIWLSPAYQILGNRTSVVRAGSKL